MKRFLFIAVLLTLPLFLIAQNKKVAVYVMGEDAGINKVLGSKLVSAIAQSEDYTAIERTAAFLAELSKEQSYQRTGAVDDSELSRLGKQFGVQYICVAAVSEAFNEKFLSARLIDVESAQVERTAISSGTIQSLTDIVNAANAVSQELLSSIGKRSQLNYKKVAVYVVKSDLGENIEKVLGDKLVAGFTQSGRYIAIERTNSFLEQLNKEQNYQHSGAVDDNDLSRLGKQFGVQYVCVVDVSKVFSETYISARLIDVETAEVVNSHDVGGEMHKLSDCLNFANEISSNLSKGTFAEQAEEARLAKMKAEEEEERQAEEARKRAEEEKAKRIAKRKEELKDMWDNGYIIIKTEKGEKWMVCIEPIEITADESREQRTYSRCGYSDWMVLSEKHGTDIYYSCYLSSIYLPQDKIENFINGYSDEITYDITYIANEYLHYFNLELPIYNKKKYWYAPSARFIMVMPCKKEHNPIAFLDGDSEYIWGISMFDRGIIHEDNFKPKIWKTMKAYGILVRRM